MSFQDKLKENQMKHAETALLQTIFQDPGQTIGDIWDALEADAESEAMWEMFKRIPIGTLVTAGVAYAEKKQADTGGKKAKTVVSAPTPAATKKAKPSKDEEEDDADFEDEDDDFEDEEDDEESDDDSDDDEDEDEDDDEEDDEEEDNDSDDEEEEDSEDDDSDEEDDDEDEDKPKRAKSRKKAKATSSKKEPASLDLSSPEALKAYRHAIIKCLKTNKAKSEDKGMRSTPIRESIGGDAKQFRDAINELIEAERVSYSGKARGTQYWLS